MSAVAEEPTTVSVEKVPDLMESSTEAQMVAREALLALREEYGVRLVLTMVLLRQVELKRRPSFRLPGIAQMTLKTRTTGLFCASSPSPDLYLSDNSLR